MPVQAPHRISPIGPHWVNGGIAFAHSETTARPSGRYGEGIMGREVSAGTPSVKMPHHKGLHQLNLWRDAPSSMDRKRAWRPSEALPRATAQVKRQLRNHCLFACRLRSCLSPCPVGASRLAASLRSVSGCFTRPCPVGPSLLADKRRSASGFFTLPCPVGPSRFLARRRSRSACLTLP
jgi:hypothetical protein